IPSVNDNYRPRSNVHELSAASHRTPPPPLVDMLRSFRETRFRPAKRWHTQSSLVTTTVLLQLLLALGQNVTLAADPVGTGGPSVVHEGDDALLTCVVMTPYNNDTVLWRKGPNEILAAGTSRVTSDKRISILHDDCQQELSSKHPNTRRTRAIVDPDRTSFTQQILGVVEAPPVRSSQHTRNWWTTLGAPWKPEEGRTRSYGSIPLSAIGEGQQEVRSKHSQAQQAHPNTCRTRAIVDLDRTSFTQQILGVVEAPPVRSSQHTRNWWTTLGAPWKPEEGRTRSYGSIPLSAIGEGQQEVRSKHSQAQQAHPITCRTRAIVDLDRTSFTQQILGVVEAPPVRSSQHTRNWWTTLGAPWKPEEGRTRSYGSIPLSAIGEGQQEVRSKHSQAQQAHPNTCRTRAIVDLDRTSFTQQILGVVEAPPVRSSQHTRNWWTTLGAPWKPEEGRTRSYGSGGLSAIGEGQQEVRSKHSQAQQAHPNTCRTRAIVDLDRTSFTQQILGVVEAPPVRSSQHTRNWWTTLGAPWKPEEGRTRSYGSIPLSAIGEGQQEVRSKHSQAQQAHPSTCRTRAIVDLDRTSFTQQILGVVEAPPVRSSQHTRNWWTTLGAPWRLEEGRTRSYGSIPLSEI
ncbi:hypothetical protein pipiens_010938, partial [Culex pipiens pipiens]